MTLFERYQSESTWQGKVLVMEIYHLAMIQRSKNWTLRDTATQFSCSIGLVSENLKLAGAIHTNEKLITYESRQEALRKLKN